MAKLVGDLIDESHYVLFANDIHCFNPKSTKPNLVLYGGVRQDKTLIGTLTIYYSCSSIVCMPNRACSSCMHDELKLLCTQIALI